MTIDWVKTLTIIFSASALCVSIVGLVLTRKNLRKQLRLAKLEEMLEIINFLTGYYAHLYRLFIDTEEKIKLTSARNKIPQYLTELDRDIKVLESVLGKELVIQKTLRVRILAEAYLPDVKDSKLKMQVYIAFDLYYHMYMFVFTGYVQNEQRQNIITPAQMTRLTNSFIIEIIKEMGLGYKSINAMDFLDYRRNQFKKDIEKLNKKLGY